MDSSLGLPQSEPLESRLGALLFMDGIGICHGGYPGIYSANHSFCAQTRYTPQDFAAGEVTWKQLVSPQYHAQWEHALAELADHGAFRPMECEFLGKHGCKVPVLVAASLCSRRPVEWIILSVEMPEGHRDPSGFEDLLSEMKAEKDRLGREAGQWRSLLEGMGHGVIVVNRTGEAIFRNAAAKKILGLDPEAPDTPETPFLALCTTDGTELDRSQYPSTRSLGGNPPEDEELILVRLDGHEVFIRVRSAPVRGADGAVAYTAVSFSDITHVRQLEETRRGFLHALSHDARTPLAIVSGAAQLIAATKISPQVKGWARQIISAAESLSRMINDLSDAAQLESGSFSLDRRPISMSWLVDEYLQGVQATLGSDRSLVVEDGEELEVLADPVRLRQVIGNLISNALKYSPACAPVSIRWRREGPFAVVEVRDFGTGIAPGEIPLVFRQFYRTQSARLSVKGTGMGLYIARMLIEAHGGRIWAESEVGHGSVFRFSVPLAASDAHSGGC